MPLVDLPYAMKRHWMASMRMNLDHFGMTRLTGYLLHPVILVGHESLRVADPGAGTGIWASELAARYPSAAVDAIDISANQFPPEGWRTPNVTFTTLDCVKPFPEGYQGQYDVVNLRFWLCIVDYDIVESLLANILTLLKPGGYIQWFESLPLTAIVKARNKGRPTPGCDQLVRQWYKPAAHSSYNETLCNLERYQPIACQSWLAGIEEYLYLQDEADQMEQLQNRLIEEAKDGAYVDVQYTLVVGRKAPVA